MGWFDRQLDGREPEALDDELGRLVRAAGVDRCLHTVCGPYGIRRFVIRFEVKGDRVVLTDLETHPLPQGGGPPDPRGAEEGIQPLEAAINRLYINMVGNMPWSRGAVAVLRDALDAFEILPLFDDDADAAVLADLGVPEGRAIRWSHTRTEIPSPRTRLRWPRCMRRPVDDAAVGRTGRSRRMTARSCSRRARARPDTRFVCWVRFIRRRIDSHGRWTPLRLMSCSTRRARSLRRSIP